MAKKKKNEQVKFLNLNLLKTFSFLFQIFLQAEPVTCHVFLYCLRMFPKTQFLSPCIIIMASSASIVFTCIHGLNYH